MARAHRRYGDAFTITIGHEPAWVMLAHPDHVREVFTGDPDVFHAGEGNVILRPLLGSNSVLLLDGASHMAQRKLLLPPFHGSRLAGWTELMRDIAEHAIDRWDGEVTAQPQMQSLTLDIVLRVIFGTQPGPRHDALHEGLRRTLDLTGGPRGIALMAILGPDRAERYGVFRSVLGRVDALIDEEIAERRVRPGDDVLSLLLQARHEGGEPMTGQEIRDELMTLLVAGHETTATALSWALERLARHPDAWQRLRDEGEPYADAIVKETLRLRPVLPVVVRKLTRDHTIAGLDLPAGTVVAPCIWLLHRRADLYPDPAAFRPERFLGVKPGTYTWIPFGGGVRRCLGAAFAEMEMRTVLCAIAERFDVSPAVDGSEPVRRRAITLTPGAGGRLRVAARAPGAASSSASPRSAPAVATGPTG
jgi:cytochrome P450